MFENYRSGYCTTLIFKILLKTSKILGFKPLNCTMHWFSFSSSRHNAGEVRVQKCSFLDFLQALQRLSVSACNESTTHLCSTSAGAFYSSDFYQCPLILARMFLCVLVLGGDVQLLNSLFWGGAPKSYPMGTKVCFSLSVHMGTYVCSFPSDCEHSLLLKVQCSLFFLHRSHIGCQSLSPTLLNSATSH